MPDPTTLVARLRALAQSDAGYLAIADEAADRIEALEGVGADAAARDGDA